ncbi:MAG: hypothetical protein H6Q72_4285 [Firmicutes bacterium]|nr:hypothetical protein [Bacillota bacterium]
MEEKIQAAIDNWFHTKIHNSPLSQNVEAYNHLQAALGDLKAALMELLPEEKEGGNE